MSERSQLFAAAIENAAREPDSRRFIRTLRRTYLDLLGREGLVGNGAVEAPRSHDRLDRVRRTLEQMLADGSVVAAAPIPAVGFEHCVALGKLIDETLPGFDDDFVGVVIKTGGVLTVAHGEDAKRIAFGADLTRVDVAQTRIIRRFIPSPTHVDAMVALLLNGVPDTVKPCDLATTDEFELAERGVLVSFDAQGQRSQLDLFIADCERGPLGRPWEFVAVDPSGTGSLAVGDSGSPFYIDVGAGPRVAGLLRHRLNNLSCGPGALFTRVDQVRDWALEHTHHINPI